MPTGAIPHGEYTSWAGFNHPKIWGYMPTHASHVLDFGAVVHVSIIRRCVGTCRLMQAMFWTLAPWYTFQSSEDVWGHADSCKPCSGLWRRGTRFNHPKMCGDMPTKPGAGFAIADDYVFQSSEDVWGHADARTNPKGVKSPMKFQSSEDVWGHADYWVNFSAVASDTFQSSEDVWGHADLFSRRRRRLSCLRWSFNHPKMWGDMPTNCAAVSPKTMPPTFQSSEDVWGHADTDEMELYARATAEFQSSEDVWGHADTPTPRNPVSPLLSFQSSEDVWGHADRRFWDGQPGRAARFNHPKMCGDMPTPKGEKPVKTLRLLVFQSSEDVWGHADVSWGSGVANGR